MNALLRRLGRSVVISLAAASALGFAILRAQTTPVQVPQAPPAVTPVAAAPAAQAAGQGASATNTPAAPPVRVTPPDQQAYTDALKITDPAKKLEAMRKIQTDFPGSGPATSADNQILDLLIGNWPDRKQDIIQALDRIIAGLPTAAGSADFRLTQVTSLVTKLVDKNLLLDKAEAMVGDAMEELDRQNKMTRARAIETLGTIHLARGDTARAEKEFKDALAANSLLARAPLELGKMEAKRGNDKAALNYLMTASVVGRLKPADDELLRSLYKKANGTDANFEAAVDKAFDEKFPNPVKPQPWVPTPARTARLVVGEMFTGSGCGPCVSADLALEDVLKRYPSDAVLALAYHANIPLPDPMVTTGSEARRKYYAVNGVPTFEVNGATVGAGGGSRENTPRNYSDYTSNIDRQLESQPTAAVALRATTDGKTIKVTVTVSSVKDGTKDPRLQLVLAEHQLRFMGENGIRYHEMVVRSVAIDPATPAPPPAPAPPAAGSAVPGAAAAGPSAVTGFSVKPTGETVIEYTFDLSAIRDDITKNIADEIVKRRKLETAGSTPREYRAENNAMIAIDPAALTIVAFVQDADKHILQAARADLSNYKPASGSR